MPSASSVVFQTAETAAAAALTIALQGVISNKDTNQNGAQAAQLAAAISTYIKATFTPVLAAIDVSP